MGKKAWAERFWRVWQRRFKSNFAAKKMIWEVCVRSIVMCGIEVWGMKENEKVERLQVQFLKRAPGVERTTPSYIVLQETNS